jgi:hypothetical protein
MEQEKLNKAYLMIGGTFLPAFSGIAVLSLIRKDNKVDKTAIVVFAGLSILGGYFTAKIINK